MPVPAAIKRAGGTAVTEYEKVQRQLSDKRYDLRKAKSPETLAAEGACVAVGAYAAGAVDALGFPKIGETPGSAALGVASIVIGMRSSGKTGRCAVLAGYGMIAPALYSYGFSGGLTLNSALADAKATMGV
jgi:hypothetical protein